MGVYTDGPKETNQAWARTVMCNSGAHRPRPYPDADKKDVVDDSLTTGDSDTTSP